MFNSERFWHLYGCATALGFGFGDTRRWLWSYYASRLPVARSHASKCAQLSIRNGGNKPMRLLIRNNGLDWTLVEEIFMRKVYDIQLKNVRRILDLGGNIGLTTLFYTRHYPGASICTVEPIPDNLQILNRNVELNGGSVRVVSAAVGAEDGRTQFELSMDPRQHSATKAGNTIAGLGKTLEVEVKSVPSLMQLMGWDEIDLLKIDIEGGETEVLSSRPGWLKKVRAIVGEGHDKVGYDIDACRRDLEPMGFDVQLLNQSKGAMVFVARRAA